MFVSNRPGNKYKASSSILEIDLEENNLDEEDLEEEDLEEDDLEVNPVLLEEQGIQNLVQHKKADKRKTHARPLRSDSLPKYGGKRICAIVRQKNRNPISKSVAANWALA